MVPTFMLQLKFKNVLIAFHSLGKKILSEQIERQTRIKYSKDYK